MFVDNAKIVATNVDYVRMSNFTNTPNPKPLDAMKKEGFVIWGHLITVGGISRD